VSAAQLGPAAVGAGLGLVDDLVWADTVRRGWLSLTVTAASIRGDYQFVDTVKSQTYAVTTGRTVTVQASGAVSVT
jgi:alkaline phosphatase D